MTQESDLDTIRETIGRYFEGHATGDASLMREVFLPTARVEGLRNGEFVSWSLEEYCAIFTGSPAPDEIDRRRTIDSADVVGTSGMAKATLVHGPITFTDFFLLVKIDEKWRIASKVYDARR